MSYALVIRMNSTHTLPTVGLFASRTNLTTLTFVNF